MTCNNVREELDFILDTIVDELDRRALVIDDLQAKLDFANAEIERTCERMVAAAEEHECEADELRFKIVELAQDHSGCAHDIAALLEERDYLRDQLGAKDAEIAAANRELSELRATLAQMQVGGSET